ncbi:MAG: prepilin-type N-terminal cleavage/methylation domain-containing protein [Candidatus Liptonbacteria bacterium]|nr:prepilin-type N-terminal cleavage/methylation domain-containing protein [Candidatus Liptonbacteria bacterium]
MRNEYPIKKRDAFTLIEVLIYIALFSATLFVFVMVFYQLIDSRDQNQLRVEVEEEANFLMKKIEWGLLGADSINEPAPGSTSTVLSVNKFNFPDNPLVFTLAGDDITLSRGAGAPAALNSERITVRKLEFAHVAAFGSRPSAVSVTLQAFAMAREGRLRASTTIENTFYTRRDE